MNQQQQPVQETYVEQPQEQINQDNVELLPNAVSVQYNANESNENSRQISILPTDRTTMHRYLHKRRLELLYPTKIIATYSFVFLVLNVFVIVIEYSYNLPIAKIRSNPYNSLLTTRYIATTSFFNIFYAMLAIISTKFKRYFLIQLLSILFVVAFFASFIQLFLFNLGLLIIESTFEQCNITCFLVHLAKAVLGFFSSFLAVVLFIKIQVKFLPTFNNLAEIEVQ